VCPILAEHFFTCQAQTTTALPRESIPGNTGGSPLTSMPFSLYDQKHDSKGSTKFTRICLIRGWVSSDFPRGGDHFSCPPALPWNGGGLPDDRVHMPEGLFARPCEAVPRRLCTEKPSSVPRSFSKESFRVLDGHAYGKSTDNAHCANRPGPVPEV